MSDKKTIGILYIATGPYIAFWEDFYKTFEAKFLTEFERHYYVFTDAAEIYAEGENVNIHKYFLKTLPWPLITLFRFDTFLYAEGELSKMDYLMFSNSNMVCDDEISPEEFLPREDNGEQLFVTVHPGYADKSGIYAPFDRNKKSSAYVPYNCGKTYVIGAMNGGTAKAFLEMSRKLDYAIKEDLKKNVIARWHDESQLNHYIIGREDVRVLGPEYCYPYGKAVSYEKKISAVSKQAKFDAKTFKGLYEKDNESFVRKIYSVVRGIGGRILPIIFYIKDLMLFKKVR